jgi:uncharacterized membrane protein HdeD (DUF308 family)
MRKNFNKSGRFVRFILGAIALILSLTNYFEDPLIGYVLLGLGIVLIVTAIIQFCPLYYFLGIDTFKSKNKMKMY